LLQHSISAFFTASISRRNVLAQRCMTLILFGLTTAFPFAAIQQV
jgi:hypothetical protein